MEFTMAKDSPSHREIKVSIMTMNMGNAPLDTLDDLFVDEPDADIYAFGLQESTYSGTKKENSKDAFSDRKLSFNGPEETHAPILKSVSSSELDNSLAGASFRRQSSNTSKTDSSSEIEDAILHKLNEELYYKVGSRQRAQMQILVFARISLRGYIPSNKIQTNAENTGFAHVFPNKGGICLSMVVDGTSLAFISCHLAAHEGVEKCRMRNNSIEEILGGVRFNEKYDVSMTHHHTFLMGDLNYRITFDPKTPADLEAEKRPNSADNQKTSRGLLSVFMGKKKKRPKSARQLLVEAAAADPNGGGGGDKHDNRSEGESAPSAPGTPTATSKDDDDENEVHFPEMTKERLKQMEQVFALIESKSWDELLKYDELIRELSANRLLEGFQSCKPSFPPTFKRVRKHGLNCPIALNDVYIQQQLEQDEDEYFDENKSRAANSDVGTEDSGTVSHYFGFYDKKRMPSYTDRVLYHSLPGFNSNLKLLKFESYEGIMSSDHKPVRAIFQLETTPNYFSESGATRRGSFFKAMANNNNNNNNNNTNNTVKSNGADAVGNQETSSTNVPSDVHSMTPTPPIPSETPSGDRSSKRLGFTKKTSNNLEAKENRPLRPYITLTRLRGKDLAVMDLEFFGGGSDPYITITLDPPQLQGDEEGSEVRSRTIYHELNPNWGDDELKIKLISCNREELSTAHVRVSVWDADNYTNDDLIGSCMIPIADLIPNTIVTRDMVGFETITGPLVRIADVRLRENALFKGYLSFDIQMKFVPESPSTVKGTVGDFSCNCILS